MKKFYLICKVCVMVICFGVISAGAEIKAENGKFVHTGIFYQTEDFQRAKAKVAAGEQPWLQAWEITRATQWGNPNYVPHPFAAPVRNAKTETRVGDAEMFDDSFAALLHAIIYRVSNDPQEAENSRQKAEGILNAWAYKVNTVISGGGEPQLLAGLCGYKFAAAADIMRSDKAWVEAGHLAKVQSMLKNYFVPICQEFLSTHFRPNNGPGYPYYYRGNQDLAAIITIMSTGILNDDQDLYDEAIRELKKGYHNGRIDYYMFPTSDKSLAQGEESGRDQAHAQLGIGLIASMARASYIQHLANPEIENLYEYNDRILLKATEYVAKYNLGYDDLPFTPLYTASNNTYDSKGVRIEDKLSPRFRGELRPGYDQVWNYYHYVDKLDGNDKGSPLYYTRQAIDKGLIRDHTDNLPFSQLLTTKEPRAYMQKEFGVSIVPRGDVYKYWTTDASSDIVKATKELSSYTKAGKSEIFYAVYVGDGAYTLKQASSGRYIVTSAPAEALHLGGKMPADDDSSKFLIQDCGNGYISIKSVKTGQFVRIDIATGQMYADQASMSGGNIVNRFRICTQVQ